MTVAIRRFVRHGHDNKSGHDHVRGGVKRLRESGSAGDIVHPEKCKPTAGSATCSTLLPGATLAQPQRARVGSRLNLVESQTQANEAFKITAEETLSNVADLDYAEATTRLQTQLVVLEAAQQSYIKIQGMSLFNFPR